MSAQLFLHRDDSLPNLGVFRNATYERLEMHEVRERSDVLIDSCDIERLELTASTFSALRITRSRIGRLVLKKLRATADVACVIDTSQIEHADLFDVSGLDWIDVRVSSLLSIGSPEGALTLDGVVCDQLMIGDSRRRPVAQIELKGCRIQGDAEIRNLSASSVAVRDSSVSNLFVRDVAITGREGLVLDTVSVGGRLTVRGAEFSEDGRLCIRSTWVARETELDGISGIGHELGEIANTELLGGLRVGGATCGKEAMVIAIEQSRVTGPTVFEGLGEDDGPSLQVRLEVGAQIDELVVPAELRVTRGNVQQLADDMFAASGYKELQTIRRGLGRQGLRPDEEDAAYFAARSEQATESRVEACLRWVMGEVFGWGVAPWPPLRALLLGVALTAIIVTIAGGVSSEAGIGSRVTGAVVGAVELWTGIGSGHVDTDGGSIVGVFALVSGVLGLVLITVAVGIVIRKLVR